MGYQDFPNRCVITCNYFQMWIYALGVTLRHTLKCSSPPVDVIMDNQQKQPVSSLSGNKGPEEQDYYQSDRQRTMTGTDDDDNILTNCRRRSSSDRRRTNTSGEYGQRDILLITAKRKTIYIILQSAFRVGGRYNNKYLC